MSSKGRQRNVRTRRIPDNLLYRLFQTPQRSSDELEEQHDQGSRDDFGSQINLIVGGGYDEERLGDGGGAIGAQPQHVVESLAGPRQHTFNDAPHGETHYNATNPYQHGPSSSGLEAAGAFGYNLNLATFTDGNQGHGSPHGYGPNAPTFSNFDIHDEMPSRTTATFTTTFTAMNDYSHPPIPQPSSTNGGHFTQMSAQMSAHQVRGLMPFTPTLQQMPTQQMQSFDHTLDGIPPPMTPRPGLGFIMDEQPLRDGTQGRSHKLRVKIRCFNKTYLDFDFMALVDPQSRHGVISRTALAHIGMGESRVRPGMGAETTSFAQLTTVETEHGPIQETLNLGVVDQEVLDQTDGFIQIRLGYLALQKLRLRGGAGHHQSAESGAISPSVPAQGFSPGPSPVRARHGDGRERRRGFRRPHRHSVAALRDSHQAPGSGSDVGPAVPSATTTATPYLANQRALPGSVQTNPTGYAMTPQQNNLWHASPHSVAPDTGISPLRLGFVSSNPAPGADAGQPGPLASQRHGSHASSTSYHQPDG